MEKWDGKGVIFCLQHKCGTEKVQEQKKRGGLNFCMWRFVALSLQQSSGRKKVIEKNGKRQVFYSQQKKKKEKKKAKDKKKRHKQRFFDCKNVDYNKYHIRITTAVPSFAGF